jgi:hypothetical protein
MLERRSVTTDNEFAEAFPSVVEEGDVLTLGLFADTGVFVGVLSDFEKVLDVEIPSHVGH